jgi:hypothetical protein
LSSNSFVEVASSGDSRYLQWAYDVLDHWQTCVEESGEPCADQVAIRAIDSGCCDYLSSGDKTLLKDALGLECDTFLTMENKLPKNAFHIERKLGIRVLTPIEMWEILRPWAALFR